MIHFANMIQTQTAKYGEKAAYRFKSAETGLWTSVSWRQFNESVHKAALALAQIGTKAHENIGVYSQNMPEYLIVEFAFYQNRAVSVPMYATSSVPQIEYIIKDAAIETLFVGEQFQYDNAWKATAACESLKQIIIFDKKVKKHATDKSSLYFDEFINIQGITPQAEALVVERSQEAKEDDLAALLYTSGTTGEPKGVMLLHSNFLEAMRIHPGRLPDANDQDISLSFLPMTHVFEKTWCYFCLSMGIEIVVNKDPKVIQETLKEIRPTLMCAVPRFWEKVYDGVQEKIHASSPVAKKLFMDALETGRVHNMEYLNKGKTPPLLLSLKYKFYEKTLFSKVKKVVGLDKQNFFPVAGAALSEKINVFLHSLGINVLYGYGLTESTATVACFWKTGYKIGTVGTIMPGVEVKIGEENEILLKGKTIFPGYYNKPEENAKSFVDGWFRTGDAGGLDGDCLIMTERIKDLFKTSNGKYIAPQAIELVIGEDKYIDQIVIFANERKYVSALIVPIYPLLRKYAEQNGITFATDAELVAKPEIIDMLKKRIDKLQKDFAGYEQVKRFTLLPQPFTIESGELTNTLKVRRRVIEQKYIDVIENMY